MKPINFAAALFLLLPAVVLQAQQRQDAPQPPPFTAPNPPTPAAPNAPGQQAPPNQQLPQPAPDAPLPRPDRTTIDLRDITPLSTQPQTPQASADIHDAATTNARPHAEAPSPFNTSILNFIAPYHAPNVPGLPTDSPMKVDSLIRNGKLYLSLHDAITLAIQNNLDVEISRYNLLLADTDLTRAHGGGTLRGIDYDVQQTAPGVGAVTSPLLITATTGNAASSNAVIADLSQTTQAGTGAQQSLSEGGEQAGATAYSTGPNLPLFDPTLIGEAGFLRRFDQSSLPGAGSTTATQTGALNYISAGLDYQQGFSPGTQLEVYGDNASQVLYGNTSQYDPLHSPSFSATATQPLLRGRGRAINLRFIHIAQLNQKVSRLVFEQQLLETVYGISRLYYDLVSLGENVGVKEESLAAAQKLYDDDHSQVELGTLAPIELTRAQALLSSSRLDLIQARSEYRQQEVILREQLVRKLSAPGANLTAIVPTDTIEVPDTLPAIDVDAFITDALANRPDLAQAGLQIQADEIAAAASHNSVKPELNAYANVQIRGSSIVPYQVLGSPGTGITTANPALVAGGLRQSTIYQGGVQLSLPLHNRIAQADAVRDAIQLRQAQGRSLKLENDIRQQIENATIALDSAHQAYAAAVESRNYQQQLLQAEIDKFSVGESTNYLIVQDQAFLSQARSTEVAARSNWMKARMALDRALGNLLKKNNIVLDDAIANTSH